MIALSCARCAKKLQVKVEAAGKRVRCPGCREWVEVPAVPDQVADLATLPPPGSEVADEATLPPLAADGAPADAGAALSQPTRSRYQLADEIARGGMGAVLRAVDQDIEREVALKYLLNQADARQKARFIEEAKITGQLEHPNIVPIHDLGLDQQGKLYFSMKMVKGQSLADVLKADVGQAASLPGQSGKLAARPTEYTLGRLLTIFNNVCNALAYAHSRQVIHRDLKPANIMVGDFGETYVMDWGLAKVQKSEVRGQKAALFSRDPKGSAGIATGRPSDSNLTQDGAVMGTPAYMPPEQARGEEVDQRADIYSLGAILYEILTLTPPVGRGGDMVGILMRVAEGQIEAPEQRAPKRWVPPELSAIAMKALAKDRADRYQTVEHLQRDIQLFQEGRSVSAKQDSAWEMFKKLVKRNKGVSITTAAALVIVAALAGFFLKVNYDARVQAESSNAAFLKEQERRRASLPSFLTAAQLLIDKRKFDGARAQVELVLDLDAEHLDALFLRGQLAMIGQDFANATADLEAYSRARPQDTLAQDLLALAPRAKPDDEATQLSLAQVFGKHGAYAMADGAVAALGNNALAARQKLLDLYRARIDKTWPGRSGNLSLAADGAFHFRFVKLKNVTDLSPLRGMPITSLDVSDLALLRDLTPLAGMPLMSLNCSGTKVVNLAPLSGMALTDLNCYGTAITDLSPLKGMPLQSLTAVKTQVADLTPLSGMPLKHLEVSFTKVVDLAPLKGLPLESLVFTATNVTDLTPLEGMPLKTLTAESTEVADLTPLSSMPLTYLNLNSTKVADLTALEGMPLRMLAMYGTKATDLTPLQGMPLTSLNIMGTPATDLTPLEGMALEILRFTPSRVKVGLELVRNMKSLRRIGNDSGSNQPTLSAEEFWKRYDAGKLKK